MIYVDNAATTFPKPEAVYEIVDRTNREFAFNAGRGESLESEEATSIIETARKNVASFLKDVSSNRVVFTSSATDALNKIILGMELVEGDVVYISPFEHNAIIRPLRRLEKNGVKVKVLPFDPDTWDLDVEEMEQQFALDNPTAVLISHISNVTGYELPVEAIFSRAKRYKAITVLDAAQSYGVFDIPALPYCSYVVFAGHKSLYGTFGVAGFVVVKDENLAPIIAGGTGSDSLNSEMPDALPSKYESGSANVVAISSLNASVPWLKEKGVREHEQKLSEMLRSAVANDNKVKIFFPNEKITNGVLSIAIKGYSSSDIGIILRNNGISARTGYHCAPLIHDFIGSKTYEGTVRFSFGAFNTEEDVTAIAQVLEAL